MNVLFFDGTFASAWRFGGLAESASLVGGFCVGLDHRLRFLKGYIGSPNVVGAVAPSSHALARALCEPYCRFAGPASVLEVGAGTGAVTRYLGTVLGHDDELDICEIHPEFADILERDVLTHPVFAPGVAGGRVRLLRAAAQGLGYESRYDFVISGLPFTAFPLRDVQDIFDVIQRSLKPGGIFSYFEYVGLRRTSRFLSVGRRRERIRSVSAFLSRNIREHQFSKKTVFGNIPPACTRHLRFDGESSSVALAPDPTASTEVS
jgi:phospholipid N-methyltransferase